MITQQVRFREDLKNWALRKLGAPALQINVTPEQIEDRIDEALDVYWRWHFDGGYRDYIIHPLTQDNIDSKSVVLDPWVYTVNRIIHIGGAYASMNLEYQSVMQNIGTQVVSGTGGLLNYTVAMSYMGIVDDYFRRKKIIDFTFTRGVLFIRSGVSEYKIGDHMVIEVYRFCDPNEYPRVWGDLWLKRYTSVLIKKQWGQNMSKYSGFQLPSGITLNGDVIYQDALREILELEEQMHLRESLPPDFYVG